MEVIHWGAGFFGRVGSLAVHLFSRVNLFTRLRESVHLCMDVEICAIFAAIFLHVLGFGVIKLIKWEIFHLSQRKDLWGEY